MVSSYVLGVEQPAVTVAFWSFGQFFIFCIGYSISRGQPTDASFMACGVNLNVFWASAGVDNDLYYGLCCSDKSWALRSRALGVTSIGKFFTNRSLPVLCGEALLLVSCPEPLPLPRIEGTVIMNVEECAQCIKSTFTRR